jgi:asparagine N-glycosylation enzyme membrane subunit Stt3
MTFFHAVPGHVVNPLKLGVAAFMLALCGVAFGLAIDYGPEDPLSYVVFGTVVLSVVVGLFAIVWGWLSTLRYQRARSK